MWRTGEQWVWSLAPSWTGRGVAGGLVIPLSLGPSFGDADGEACVAEASRGLPEALGEASTLLVT